MANLTNTQRKNRNKLIALSIAIVVVIAAIVLVVYNGLTVASFENENFEEAVATALGQDTGSVKKGALEEVKYVEIANDGQQIQAFFGYDDFLEQKARYTAEQEAINAATSEDQTKRNEMFEAAKEEAKTKATEAGEDFDEEAFTKDFDMDALETGVVIPEATVNHPVELTKKAAADSTAEYINLNDVKNFKNAEEVILMGAKVDAESILALTNAKVITLTSSKVDNVTELAKLDFTKVEMLTLDEFMFESEEQFEAFKPNGEKVTIMSYYPIQDGNGNVLQYFPYEITVAEMFAEPETDAADGDADATDAEATNEDATNEEAANEEATNEEATNEEATNEEATNEEATDEEAANEEANNEEATNEEANNEEATAEDAPAEDLE